MIKNSFFLTTCLILVTKFLSANTATSHSNEGIYGGVCLLCSIENPELAYDGNLSTYQNYELSAGVSSYGMTTFEFDADIPTSSVITLTMGFPDLVPNFFGDINGPLVFENTWVELLDMSGANIFTYNQLTESTVEVINGTQNIVNIKIINTYQGVQKIRLRSGALLSVIGDVRLYEIKYDLKDFIFANRYLTSGYFNGTGLVSVDINHKVENPEHAISQDGLNLYDVNSQYTSFQYLLNVNLTSEYLFSKYDWSGNTYSGVLNNLFIFFEDANLVALSDISLLFDTGLIEIIVGYSDGSSYTFDSSNPLIEVKTAVTGSGRFYVEIDLEDSKFIENVEVRFMPFASALSDLRLYNIFVSEAIGVIPLPQSYIGSDINYFEEHVIVNWTTCNDLHVDFYVLEYYNEKLELIKQLQIKRLSENGELITYSATLNREESIAYCKILEVDYNNQREYIDQFTLNPKSNNILVYPNPSNGKFTLEINDKLEYFLFNSHGKCLGNVTSGEVEVNVPGVYIIKSLVESGNKKIRLVVQ